jgi:hypothetical protein
MFTRSSSVEPKTLEPARTVGANGTQRSISPPSNGEKSVIGNDLTIIGQGLRIISRGMLQVDGDIEGDVQAAVAIQELLGLSSSGLRLDPGVFLR